MPSENKPGISAQLTGSRIQEYHNQVEKIKQLGESSGSQQDLATPAMLADSVSIILEYAECSGEMTSSFKNTLAAYKQLSDKNSTSQEAMKIRRSPSRSA